MGKSKIIILIPSHNEYHSLKKLLPQLKKKYDFLVVNDFSTDKTEKYLKSKKFKYLNNNKHFGYENSILNGMNYILRNFKKKKYIITFDADNEHKIKDISKFEKLIQKKNIDLLIGQRNSFNRFFEKIISLIFEKNFNIRDPLSGFKLYNMQTLKKNLKNVKKNLFLVDLTILILRKKKLTANILINVNKRIDSPRIGSFIKVNFRLLKIIFYLLFLKN